MVRKATRYRWALTRPHRLHGGAVPWNNPRDGGCARLAHSLPTPPMILQAPSSHSRFYPWLWEGTRNDTKVLLAP